MWKKKLSGTMTLPVGVMLIFCLIGCSNDGGGSSSSNESGGVVKPTVINGYYGVTADGKTIEVIITPTAHNVNVDFGTANNYVIKIDGVEKSKGTVTKSGSAIVFTASDGSAVNAAINSNGDLTSLSVTKSGATYTAASMVTSSDYFYAIGGPTNQSEKQIKEDFLGGTPTQIKNYLYTHLGDYDYHEGTFDEIMAFGKSWKCPDKELSQISKEMNSGSFYGIGYYKHSQYGNIVYCVSRLPFSTY